MTLEIDFAQGTVVTSDWLDAMQEIHSGAAWNVHLTASGTTRGRVIAGTGKDQAGLTVNGRIRFNETTVETPVLTGNPAGTYNVFATADTNPPTRTFALVATTAAAPAGVTNFRKIGELVWNGTEITEVRSMASSAPTHSPVFTGTVSLPTAASSATGGEAVTAQWVRSLIAALGVAQPGDIKATAAAEAPAGWLLCDGSAVSRTTYAGLFAAIGTTFGAGDGSTTFNLPDLRGRVIAGIDNMDNPVGTGGGDSGRLSWPNTRGYADGSQTHPLTAAETAIRNHTHSGTTGNDSPDHDHSGFAAAASAGSAAHPNHQHTVSGNTTTASGGISSNTSTSGSGERVNSAHTHSFSVTSDGPNGTYPSVTLSHGHSVSVGGASVRHQHPFSTGNPVEGQLNGVAHNNMQPTMLLNYCIKT